MTNGALPIQRIQGLVKAGCIGKVKEENIRTGSLDLTPTDEFYRVRGSFLPSPDETVQKALKRVGAKHISGGTILERGACYVCKLNETIESLPEDIYGYSNPKSSSGRLDLHVRLLADRVSRYDSVPRDYRGPLWMLIVPKTFSVITPIGVALSQMRFFNRDTRLTKPELEENFERDGGFLRDWAGEVIRYKDLEHSDGDGSLILTLGLEYDVPGYEAVGNGEPIDLYKVGYYDPHEFFRPVMLHKGSLVLAANTFYILSTKEHVRVPEEFACEMAAMDERSGDIRSHYAGFIDTGWGIGADGEGKGRPLTLEVRSFDNGLIICDGQPIAKVKYERVTEKPIQHYDQMAPNYGAQSGPQLSKHFKPWNG